MPGTILVSVLEIVDLPNSSYSRTEGSECRVPFLKVIMGKKEYQTNGRGDFSFPVLSLQKNLVISLHDADGNEISRTDIKTVQVMEKGLWDAWFPLKGGGNAHLKLQFLISKGDKNRVHEMRETTALKTKYANHLIGNRMHSASSGTEETSGSSTPEVGTKLIQLDQHDEPQQAAPDESQKILVVPGYKVHQVEAEKPSYKDGFSPGLYVNDIHKIDEHTNVEYTTSSVTEKNVAWLSASSKAREDKQTVRKKFELDDDPARNVKKMISAFEDVSQQESKQSVHWNGSKIRPQLKRIQRKSTLEEALFSEAEGEKAQSGEIMAKSFFRGMLSEMNLEVLPDDLKLNDEKEREESTSSSLKRDFLTRSKNIGLEKNQKLKDEMTPESDMQILHTDETTLNLSGIESGQSWEYMRFLDGKEQEEFNGFAIKTDTVNANKTIDLEKKQMLEALPCWELKVIDDYSFLQDTKSTISDNTIDSSEKIESPQMVSPVGPKKDVDFVTCEQQSVLNMEVESLYESSRNGINESSACGSSNQFLDFVTESYLLGYPHIWIKRHVCITTSAKEYVDIIGSFDTSVGTFSRSNPFKSNVCKEVMEHGNSCTEVIKDKEIPCSPIRSNAKGSAPILKIKGKLIGQVIRITILVVACGTLFLKSK